MKRNSFLDIIKGICIVFVIMTHYAWTKTQRKEFLFNFWIGMAVPIFMIITGYVYAKSFKKNEISRFSQAYFIGNLLPYMLRFAVPITMVYVGEVFLNYFRGPKKFLAIEILIKTCSGEQKFGGYYIPLMFQFIIVFPIIYFIVKKWAFHGVLICGGINIIYELFSNFEWFEKPVYRVLIFRFLFIIAYGCYLAFNEKTKMKRGWAFISFVLGVAYLISLMNKEYRIEIFPYWKHVNILACFYIVPVMGVLIRRGKGKFLLLETIGKACFNIFLVQKVYYYYPFCRRPIYHYVNNFYLIPCANVILCCLVGVIFYYIEYPFTSKVIRMVRQKMGKKEKQKIQIL